MKMHRLIKKGVQMLLHTVKDGIKQKKTDETRKAGWKLSIMFRSYLL